MKKKVSRLIHPETETLRAARDALLAASLRPDGAPFRVAREYPIVLAAEGARFSYCLAGEGDAETVVAHANLWPRKLRSADGGREIAVGLVGNVATDARLRGQGLMTALIGELEGEARRAGL